MNLPRWRLRGCDQAGVADGISRGIEDIPVVQGRREIRMVQKIEELGSELDVEGVRNSLDLVVLQQGRIEIYESRTDQRIPPQISPQRDWIWHGKAFRFDVVVRVPWLTSELQPGAETKFGTSMLGSMLFTPRASPANPGVNATPVLASNTPPTCHPPSAHAVTPCAHFGVLNSNV